MEKAIETIEKEIKEKEEEIQRLQEAKKILEGEPIGKVESTDKPRRKIKNQKWSDVEVRQLINLYHRLPLVYTKKMTRIANIMKMPRKRIVNKVMRLKIQGLIKESTKNIPIGKKKKWTNWTENKNNSLIEMTKQGFKPKEISEKLGIDHRAVHNQLWVLRKKGILPPVRKSKHTFLGI